MSDSIVAIKGPQSGSAGELSNSNTAKSGNEEFDIWLEAGRIEKHYWLDLWRFRELFLILAWRDVAVRYKQTLIGVVWSILQPLLTMLIMSFVFGKLAGLHADGNVPYPILVFCGTLPWQFFAVAMTTSGQSLVTNASLVSKIYFPRMVIPISSVVVALVDFSVSLLILAVLMVVFHILPTWHLLILPLLLVLAFVTSLGPGLFITALNVRYRDFRFVLPFIIQFGLYLCPVGFSSLMIREKIGDSLFLLYSLNPMVGVIDGFRWAILGNACKIFWPSFGISVSVSLCLLATGIWYFRRTERTFADII
jgi:lipopolysaccharide transport system permease protein